MTTLPTYAQVQLAKLDKAINKAFKDSLTKGTQEARNNYYYWVKERERILLQLMTPSINDEEYSNLEIY